MTRYKIQTLKSLRDEMKAVARGGRPVQVDAAKPSFNSVEAAEFITMKDAGLRRRTPSVAVKKIVVEIDPYCSSTYGALFHPTAAFAQINTCSADA